MTRKYILSACLFVFAVISCVCYGAENSDRQARTARAVEEFGKENVECFEQMFQTGVFDFNYHYDSYGRYNTVLHYAALMGYLNRIKTFIEKGANVNAKCSFSGLTVLHYAVKSGKLDVIKYLVEHGADVKAKDKYGKSAIFYAVENGNLDIVKYLVEKGANFKAKDMPTQAARSPA